MGSLQKREASEYAALFSAARLHVELEPRTTLDYDADEWMAHGGPSCADAERLVALLEASLTVGRCGLDVRREHGKLRFSHTAVAYVLRRT